MQSEGALFREGDVEGRYRAIFESVPVTIWVEDLSEVRAALDELSAAGVTDLEAYLDDHPEFVAEALGKVRVLDVNRHALEMYGARTKEELFGSLGRLFTPQALENFRSVLLALAAGAAEHTAEVVTRTLTGEKRQVLLTIRFPEDASARSTVLATVTDVTELMRLERQLEASRESFESIVEASRDGILVVDPDGTVCFANSAACDMLGRQRGQLEGAAFPYDLEPRYLQEMEIISGGKPGYAELKVVATQWEGATAWLCTMRDISRRKTAERQLLAQNSLLEAINRIFEGPFRGKGEGELAEACLAAARELTGCRFGVLGEIGPGGRFDQLAASGTMREEAPDGEWSAERLLETLRAPRDWDLAMLDSPFLVLRQPQGQDLNGTPAPALEDDALLAVPLRGPTSVTGVLAVAGKPSGFEQADWQRLESLAAAFAQALKGKRMEGELCRLAVTDPLTGLYNRRGFFLLAEQQARLAQRAGRELALVAVDLNGLKKINDNHGHQAGDQALADTAAILRSTFRGSDIIARVGGDEFVVLLADDDAPLESFRARLEQSVERHRQEIERPYAISLSVGMASGQLTPGTTLADLLVAADRVLYEHKRQRA